jgi:Suppressor of forked protein (Suf)
LGRRCHWAHPEVLLRQRDAAKPSHWLQLQLQRVTVLQAQRVLEYGLSRHGHFIREPSYVLAYVEVLLRQRDAANLRVLLERVLAAGALPPERAGSVWDRFVELELWRAAVSCDAPISSCSWSSI